MEHALRAAEKKGTVGLVADRRGHVHPELEVVLVLSDNVCCTIGGQQFTLRKNTLVLFNNFEQHSLSVPGCGYHRLLLMFRPAYLAGVSAPGCDLLECFFRHTAQSAKILPLADGDAASVCEKMRELVRVTDTPEALPAAETAERQLYLQLSLARLLVEVNGLFRRAFGAKEKSEDTMLVSRVIQSIHENLDCPEVLTLDALSRRFAVSRTQLCEAFRAVTGTTARQYIIDCRIWRAQDLLAAGSTVDAAGQAAGYSDAAHFSRVFRQKTGRSPREYARLCAGGGEKLS